MTNILSYLKTRLAETNTVPSLLTAVAGAAIALVPPPYSAIVAALLGIFHIGVAVTPQK